MSNTVIKQLPVIKFVAQERDIKKRRQLIKACCDNNFIKAIAECCWNIVNGRVRLTHQCKKQLCRHKLILRQLADQKNNLKKKKIVIQGGGFASLLPLLIAPVLSGLSSLLKK